MHTLFAHQGNHISSASKVIKMDQTRIVRSLREKCGLIDHLYSGNLTWMVDADRTNYNNVTIDGLISTACHMLTLIEDDYEYMEAAHNIEKVLVKMNRFTEAAMLYSDPEEPVHH